MTGTKEPSPTALVVPMELRGSRTSASKLLGALQRDFIVKGPDSFGRLDVLVEGVEQIEDARLTIGAALSSVDQDWSDQLAFSFEEGFSLWSRQDGDKAAPETA